MNPDPHGAADRSARQADTPAATPAGAHPGAPRWRQLHVLWLGAGLLALAALFGLGIALKPAQSAAPETAAAAATPGIRVETALAARANVPVYLAGLGTVQGFYTVTITARVDGELLSLGFVEGQMVRAGDLLAQIDPRPYQAALDQAIAAKARDAALLANGRLDLQRYEMLAPEEFTSKQTLETQRALVSQFEAQLIGDQAAIDNARTQLDYTTIRAPMAARTGIRLTDPGNIVRAATATGIVVLTQVQPIAVIFTLPADALAAVRKAMAAGPVSVSALARDGASLLGTGKLALIDNLVDQTTGTIRLKAVFPNQDNALWPGDFVNARLLVRTRSQVLTIPSAAVQRGPNGVFAYVVRSDSTVEARPLHVGEESAGFSVVEQGLAEGDRVTTSNQYRLQPGAHVQVLTPASSAPSSAAPAIAPSVAPGAPPTSGSPATAPSAGSRSP
jgi:multidrug efflux system membrane fusion protein